MTPDVHERAVVEQLAQKINWLFEAVHPAGRGPYSEQEVARWLAERADEGPTISANYLRFLRRGQRTNPASNSLRAIGWFFGVDPGYLLSHDEQASRSYEQRHLASVLADERVRRIALHADHMDRRSQEWLLTMLETFPCANRETAHHTPPS